MSGITVRRASRDELGRVEALLDANDLPSRDVRAKPASFFVATADTEVVGIGGVEVHGSAGLLRSVVVTDSNRGQGYGSALVDSLEHRARTDGVETLYLLTTTAAPFFRRCEYEEITRENAPPGIRETPQFTDLCPSSATCMRKRLQ